MGDYLPIKKYYKSGEISISIQNIKQAIIFVGKNLLLNEGVDCSIVETIDDKIIYKIGINELYRKIKKKRSKRQIKKTIWISSKLTKGEFGDELERVSIKPSKSTFIKIIKVINSELTAEQKEFLDNNYNYNTLFRGFNARMCINRIAPIHSNIILSSPIDGIAYELYRKRKNELSTFICLGGEYKT